jgi:hypothetical protein
MHIAIIQVVTELYSLCCSGECHYAESCYTKCRYAECQATTLYTILVSVTLLSLVILCCYCAIIQSVTELLFMLLW